MRKPAAEPLRGYSEKTAWFATRADGKSLIWKNHWQPLQMPKFSIGDFEALFLVRNHENKPFLLIGGQAVNFWAEHYSAEEKHLLPLSPFTSADIDFRGDRKAAETIAAQLKLTPKFPSKREMTALVAVIPLKIGDEESLIEVVNDVPGVANDLIEKTAITTELKGKIVRLIDPISLLKSKGYMALRINQESRNDVAHLRIMVFCVRAYLRFVMKRVLVEELNARGWFKMVEVIMAFSESEDGRNLAWRHSIDWTNVLPLREIESAEGKQFEVFREKRLAAWKKKIASYKLERGNKPHP